MQVYQKPKHAETRWINFENKTGTKNQGGLENKGAKGHAFERFNTGETKVLVDYMGEGIVNKIWLTISNRETQTLKSIILRCYWDGAKEPSVDVPIGDFFCANLGLTSFENEFFVSPEGRSFNCFIPMPFKTNAKITLKNESSVNLSLFYDISISLQKIEKDDLYFHAFWNREQKTKLGVDYTILPQIYGEGTLLGISFGLQTNKDYKDSWWGEGEVKIYLDNDKDHPTLVGTGLEDYIGTGWGQGIFKNRYSGSLIADNEKGIWSFYKFHVKDPVYFNKDIKITTQVIGGCPYQVFKQFLEDKVEIIPVSVDQGDHFIKLFEIDKSIEELHLSDNHWVNFYRSDDYSTVCYYYLNRP